MKYGKIKIICGKRNIFNRNQWKMAQSKWKMAQIKLYVVNAIFSTEINENGIIQMKNGTVQSRVKINEEEQYIVNLSKSRRRIGMVWLYYLISERTCCVFCKFFRN